jgi:hypothetical protein
MRFNGRLALVLTKAFGSMGACYIFMLYGLLPVLPAFRPYAAAFLYGSNRVQLCSLPLLLVGTNILGRAIEARARADHEKLAQAYDKILAVLEELRRQDIVLEAQTKALTEKQR